MNISRKCLTQNRNQKLHPALIFPIQEMSNSLEIFFSPCTITSFFFVLSFSRSYSFTSLSSFFKPNFCLFLFSTTLLYLFYLLPLPPSRSFCLTVSTKLYNVFPLLKLCLQLLFLPRERLAPFLNWLYSSF